MTNATRTVRMFNERDVGRYVVEVLNLELNEIEATEYFPYDPGVGGNGDRGAAFAAAWKCQHRLADEHKAEPTPIG